MRLAPFFVDPEVELRPSDLLPPDQPAKPWPPIHKIRANALVRGLAFTGLALIASAVGSTVYFALTGRLDMGPMGVEALTIVACLGAYLLVTMLTEQRVPPFELAPRRWVGFLKGAALGAVTVALSVGLLAAFGAYRVVAIDFTYNPWADLFIAGVGAAVTEEILFRGIAFRLIEDAFGSWV
jgi:membrane protease YdiL (CAAX protease family)